MQFSLSFQIAAPPSVVYDLLDDGARWNEWAAPLIRRARWADGSPAGGAGSVRELGALLGTFRERVLQAEPGRLHAYTIDGPLPIRDYRADVVLTPSGGDASDTGVTGTEVDWSIRFTPAVPGTGLLIRAVLTLLIGFLARRLGRRAELSCR